MASTCFIRRFVMLIEGRTLVARERMDTGGTWVSELTSAPTLSVLCENCVKTVWIGKKRGSSFERKQSPEVV